MKTKKTLLIITTLVCLLPILIAAFVYQDLPATDRYSLGCRWGHLTATHPSFCLLRITGNHGWTEYFR